MELHFTKKKKILFGIPKSLVKDKVRHVEGSTHGKWGECPLFQGQVHTHTCACTLTMHAHTCAHTVHTHIPMHAHVLTHARMCVQGTSREATSPQA